MTILQHFLSDPVLLLPVALIMLFILGRLRRKSFIKGTIRLFPMGDLAAPNAGDHEVKFTNGSFRFRELSMMHAFIKAMLVPVVNQEVEVRRPGGTPGPTNAGAFHIWLNAAPLGRACVKAPKQLFGFELSDSKDCFAPSGAGVPIIDDAGNIVAELVGNDLFLLVDPFARAGTWRGSKIFAHVLAAARQEVAAARKPDADTVESLSKRFQQEMFAAIQPPVVTAGSAAAAASEGDAQQRYHQVIRETREAEQNLLRLQGQLTGELGREYDQLHQIRKIRKVTVTEENLKILTDVLYCTDPSTGNIYEMGVFEISIPFESSGDVLWHNMSRHPRGPNSNKMQALHVFENGKACMGNTRDWFRELIATRRFAEAAQLAIAFVETLNPDDGIAYQYLGNWPLVGRRAE